MHNRGPLEYCEDFLNKQPYEIKEPLDFRLEEYLEKAVEVICRYYNITKDQMFSRSREEVFRLARQVLFYLLQNRFKSYKVYQPALSKYVKMDRVTVSIHSPKVIAQEMDYNNHFADEIDLIESRILKEFHVPKYFMLI